MDNQRCGVCKHFYQFKVTRAKGVCQAPLPACIDEHLVKVSLMHVDGGTQCESFERKEVSNDR